MRTASTPVSSSRGPYWTPSLRLCTSSHPFLRLTRHLHYGSYSTDPHPLSYRLIVVYFLPLPLQDSTFSRLFRALPRLLSLLRRRQRRSRPLRRVLPDLHAPRAALRRRRSRLHPPHHHRRRSSRPCARCSTRRTSTCSALYRPRACAPCLAAAGTSTSAERAQEEGPKDGGQGSLEREEACTAFDSDSRPASDRGDGSTFHRRPRFDVLAVDGTLERFLQGCVLLLFFRSKTATLMIFPPGLRITHLRSPMFFQPSPADANALVAYAQRTGREKELAPICGVVGREFSKQQRKKKCVLSSPYCSPSLSS